MVLVVLLVFVEANFAFRRWWVLGRCPLVDVLAAGVFLVFFVSSSIVTQATSLGGPPLVVLPVPYVVQAVVVSSSVLEVLIQHPAAVP